jgi:hypothetical protein
MVNHYRVQKMPVFMIHEQIGFMYKFGLAAADRPFGFSAFRQGSSSKTIPTLPPH